MYACLLWARHCVLKILTSLGLIWCPAESKQAVNMSDGMNQLVNQRFSSNRRSPFSHLKPWGRFRKINGFSDLCFFFFSILLFIFWFQPLTDRNRLPHFSRICHLIGESPRPLILLIIFFYCLVSLLSWPVEKAWA